MITDRNYTQPTEYDRGKPWYSDEPAGAYEDYPGEQTRPDVEPEPFLCRCVCGCQNEAVNGLFCKNCDPGGKL